MYVTPLEPLNRKEYLCLVLAHPEADTGLSMCQHRSHRRTCNGSSEQRIRQYLCNFIQVCDHKPPNTKCCNLKVIRSYDKLCVNNILLTSAFVGFTVCKDLHLWKGKLAETPDAVHNLTFALVVCVVVCRRLSQQCENKNLNKPQLFLHILQNADATAYLVGRTDMFEG